jgi:hypothetical protein
MVEVAALRQHRIQTKIGWQAAARSLLQQGLPCEFQLLAALFIDLGKLQV